MPKTVKLTLNDKDVKTIEELRANFNVEEILDAYNTKTLHKWLKYKGYTSELSEIMKINKLDYTEQVEEIVKALGARCSKSEIQDGVLLYEYVTKQSITAREYKEYEKILNKIEKILNNTSEANVAMLAQQVDMDFDDEFTINALVMLEHVMRRKRAYTDLNKTDKIVKIEEKKAEEYYNIIENMLVHSEDMPLLKYYANLIEREYFDAFRLEFKETYFTLSKKAPMAIIAILACPKLKPLFVPVGDTTEATLRVYADLRKMTYDNFMNYKTRLKYDEIKVIGDSTDSSWMNIEPQDKKVMVLGLATLNILDFTSLSKISKTSGDCVRGALALGQSLTEEINYQFVVLDGLDYKSNTLLSQLVYIVL